MGLHASLGRPIWIDEFTHFAYAAEPTTREAWSLFLATADNIQHGQTGIYIILNYWTLNYLGLDATLLRLPSILSGVFLFSSAIMLFRVLGFSVLWQIVVVAALTGQHLLMYLLGEARPYAPIPAASAGLLLYYVARPQHPESWGMLLFGIFTAVFGTTMHVYFAVYWPVVCLVAYVHHRAVTHEAFSLRSLIRFANPGLVALGAGLYLLLGALTWLRGQPNLGLDPFEWLRQQGPLANFTNYSHTQFLDGSYAIAAIFTAAAMGALLLPAGLRGSAARLQAPALLVLLSLLLSVLIGWISYMADYWILPRQWVGSIALVAIGVVWFWAEAARLWARLTPLLGWALCGIAALIVSSQALNIIGVRLAELRTRLAEAPAVPPPEACEPPGALDLANMSNEDRNAVMVDLANRNIACGGPIWVVFRGYYTSQLAYWAR
ncbi:hypothetical protein KPL78_03700 [Roseomonas sp. HJA6]|uniref:Glycosyltransferase RgtA/B/C/D-like domain-containing protein n=1 Tax=Roseomonas alba TaxID=2846776 RepID=A0ABS7A6K3_9PROT|nr:hypothetical protein [Neoroseomonas alba]